MRGGPLTVRRHPGLAQAAGRAEARIYQKPDFCGQHHGENTGQTTREHRTRHCCRACLDCEKGECAVGLRRVNHAGGVYRRAGAGGADAANGAGVRGTASASADRPRSTGSGFGGGIARAKRVFFAILLPNPETGAGGARGVSLRGGTRVSGASPLSINAPTKGWALTAARSRAGSLGRCRRRS